MPKEERNALGQRARARAQSVFPMGSYVTAFDALHLSGTRPPELPQVDAAKVPQLHGDTGWGGM